MRDQDRETLTAFADRVFARRPELRSVMLCVAQYWDDEASDAVHAFIVASPRSTPLWPHTCTQTWWDDTEEEVEHVEGELCGRCAYAELRGYPFDDNGAAITRFGAYCHEHGTQDQPVYDNYTPFAIARATPAGIEIERVDTLYRPAYELLDDSERVYVETRTRPLDAQARTLFEDACAHAGDDGARRVLADHLIEQGDPRGEYLALALAPDLDAEGRARRDALLEEHRFSWIHPLGDVIPRYRAHFERGLLARAEVFCPEIVRADALAWGSVEQLHFLPGSADFVSPAMRALREVGPLTDEGVAGLAAAGCPIEQLHVRLDELAPLLEVPLPRLRHLVLEQATAPALDELRTATWWRQLERLTWLHDLEQGAAFLARHRGARPWLAAAEVREGRPAGWQLAVGEAVIEISQPWWSPRALRTALIRALEPLPRLPVRLRSSTCWQPTEDDVEALTAAGHEATIS